MRTRWMLQKKWWWSNSFFYGNQIFFYVEYDVWPSLWSSGPVSFAFRLWFSIPTIAERSSYSWDLICWNLLLISCTHSMHHRWWLKVLRREERHACMASVCMCNSTRSKALCTGMNSTAYFNAIPTFRSCLACPSKRLALPHCARCAKILSRLLDAPFQKICHNVIGACHDTQRL